MSNRVLCLLACASFVALLLPGAARPETVLEDFPVAVRSGLASSAGPSEPGEKVLPDLPFDPDQGYGYVGGTPGRRIGAAAFGGDPAWLLAWREGIEKYVFRVPRGEYLVELAFLETDVAHRGLRVFDVLAEEKAIFRRVDIAERAGDFTWLTLAGAVPVYDGWLDLRFVPATPEMPPRVSRVTIRKAGSAGGVPVELAAPRLEVSAGPGQVLLRWEAPAAPGIAGFGVLRSDAAAGPFDSLTQEPVPVPTFIDSRVSPGQEYFYKVCAYSAGGSQSPFSDPRSARPRAVHELGLRTYDLRLPEEEMKRMSVRREPAIEVPAELHSLGGVHYVLASYDTEPARWQKKKSFRIAPQVERNRRIHRRKGIHLSAEAGDPTLLREMVSAGAAASAGLATPAVEPVALLVNGVYQGVYFDVELLDRAFRQRTRLDRVGVLALDTRGDLLQRDWAPYGEQRGEEGNIMSLTEMVHELNRLGEGEMPRYFEDRLYLDRHLDRTAFRLLRGAAARERFLLRDSRNGKWEALEDCHPAGSLGVRDFETEGRGMSDADATRLVLGKSFEAGAGGREAPSVLETRFLAQPDLRRRLSERVDSLLAGALAPEKFDAIVDESFARIREAALADPNRWPAGGAVAFLAGPARLKADYRSRAEVVRRTLARERLRPPPALVLNEILARPAEGEPWVEIRNASGEPASLDGCFLSGDLQVRGPRFELGAGRVLAPGEVLGIRGPSAGSLPLSAPGGFLGLFREAPGAQRPERFDSLFYGHATRGVSYGRLAGGAWAWLATPTEGAPNEPRSLEPPPYDFRQGVVKGKDGDVKIWFKTRAGEAAWEKRPEKVRLDYREEGEQTFQAVDLAWDGKAFQFAINLAANPQRKRTAYYFTAVSAAGVERVYPLAAPELTFYLPVLPAVKLNEVLPRPGRRAGGTGESPGEFIEIYNPGDQPADLEGFFLSDSNRNPTRWRILAGSVVPPKGFLVFYADGLNRGRHTSFKLSNSGEFLGIYGRIEEGNLLVDSMAFRGVRTGESWGANPDGSKSFRAWKDPTPGGRNVPKIPEEYLKKRKGTGAAAGPGAPEHGTDVKPQESGAPQEPREPDDGEPPPQKEQG